MLAIDAEAVDVPPTIQSLLGARVERLPVDERRVLELASVIGAEFSVGALDYLIESDVGVGALLESMRRKELVEPTGTYWGDDPVHRFHHVLIRDAAYRRLLKTSRAELHRRVGEWTDASAATLIGEHEAAIAFHYEQAHRYRAELGTLDEETDAPQVHWRVEHWAYCPARRPRPAPSSCSSRASVRSRPVTSAVPRHWSTNSGRLRERTSSSRHGASASAPSSSA